MKKFSFLVAIVFVMLMFSQVFADVVTTRRINKPAAQNTQRQPQSKATTKSASQVSTNRKVNSVKTCTPYSENSQFNVDGMNFGFKIKISGWVNNKCRMDFIASSEGIASNFEALYGVDASDAQIYSFAPQFRCEFTKQQLESVGDSILEEESRKNGGKMLKDPNSIDDLLTMSRNMTGNDAALMGMLMDGRTCKLLNAGDVGKLLDSLLGF